ncbi:hypothetical protein Y032_0030g2152 [Ancylostoma ceylanicum]|uniref:Uncharacterized protein n=1 Tax=Ancylostoma ceylanicum TaxID=53326 RepID=A0A016UQB7_9BILA|nr:hypothetical protein Y032_0030g2152 [Ancylostoma ceylanicum]
MMMSCTTGERVRAREAVVVHLQKAVIPEQGCALSHCQLQPRKNRSSVISPFFSPAVLRCRRKKLWFHSEDMNECSAEQYNLLIAISQH